ncbi:MAG: hypothetical protein ACAI35_15865 [Candidatus Methylacidiphilales bacterium]
MIHYPTHSITRLTSRKFRRLIPIALRKGPAREGAQADPAKAPAAAQENIDPIVDKVLKEAAAP